MVFALGFSRGYAETLCMHWLRAAESILNGGCLRFYSAMQIRTALLLAVLGLAAPGLVAQTKRLPPNSLDPGSGFPETSTAIPAAKHNTGTYRVLAPRRSRMRKTPIRRTAQYEFYERVERAARLRQKMLIVQSKHKRSGFGHRRPPRKHPPHKMRYCDECGIRH